MRLVFGRVTSSSAVADEPARSAASWQTAKLRQQSRDHNHAHVGVIYVVFPEAIH